MQYANNLIKFPNGSMVLVEGTGDLTNPSLPPGPDNPVTNNVITYTVTKGPNGEMPPGYPGAYPNAKVQ